MWIVAIALPKRGLDFPFRLYDFNLPYPSIRGRHSHSLMTHGAAVEYSRLVAQYFTGDYSLPSHN